MHNIYDPAMEYRLLEKMPGLFICVSRLEGAGTAAVQMKQFLQRPRGYQVSLLFGNAAFRSLQAVSADTPSMVSGHCYEGGMQVGGLIEQGSS